jgi:hypothetical protein
VDSQRRRQHHQGPKNAHTLVGVEQIPCAKQMRHLRDPLAPSVLDPVCMALVQGLEQPRMFASFRGLGDPWLVAWDGTQSCASTAMHGPHGRSRPPPMAF